MWLPLNTLSQKILFIAKFCLHNSQLAVDAIIYDNLINSKVSKYSSVCVILVGHCCRVDNDICRYDLPSKHYRMTTKAGFQKKNCKNISF